MASGVILFALRGLDLLADKLISILDAIIRKNVFVGILGILCISPLILLRLPGLVWQHFYGPDSRIPEYKNLSIDVPLTRENLQPKKEMVKHKMNYK